MAMLEVTSLGISFGGLRAVDELSMKIEKGGLVGLIGPNGAGKTTVFNMLTGVYRPTDGGIRLDGQNLIGKKPHEICKLGVARTFQNIRLFSGLTVLDNVKTGLHNEISYTLAESLLHLGSYRKKERQMDEKAMELLRVFDLENVAGYQAANLPYGKQRKLEIARALATDPKLLLLDEPAAGMNPNETGELMETIELVRQRFGVTVLLIEHDMKLVSGICEYLYVLNFGRLLAEGTPARCSAIPRSSRPTWANKKGGTDMAMLEVKDINVYYGLIHALRDVSFEVNEGEVVALIGANGAGKTTTLHTITGLLPSKSGTVTFEGKNITKMPGHAIVRLGMSHVPEGRRVFAGLTVRENLRMGAYTRPKSEIEDSLAEVYKRFPRLEERKNQAAGTLSGGEQQMLAMGRALMAKPRILLLDEPSMGLSPLFVSEVFKIIQEVSAAGTTVLLVEQNAKKALSIADRAYVLETGKIIHSGKASDLLNDDAIKKAYLGE